jgi:hypothetical protein
MRAADALAIWLFADPAITAHFNRETVFGPYGANVEYGGETVCVTQRVGLWEAPLRPERQAQERSIATDLSMREPQLSTDFRSKWRFKLKWLSAPARSLSS